MSDDSDPPDCCIGEDPQPGVRTVTFDIYHTGKGWAGALRVPMDISPMMPSGKALMATTSTSATPLEAAAKTANLATLVNALPPQVKNLIPGDAQTVLKTVADPKVAAAIKSGNLKNVYEALPADVKSKIPAPVQQAAAVLTNPQLESFLRSDNPALRAANLLNITTLARPDIYAQNVAKTATNVVDAVKSLKFW